MSIEHEDGRGHARCDRCLLTTPKMRTATREAVAQMIRAAGWTIPDELSSLCPRCSGRCSTDYASVKRRKLAGSSATE